MENRNTQSPVMRYKITLVNNADLNRQYVVTIPGKPEELDDEGNIVPAVPDKTVKQFELASIRKARAIRKARKMIREGHRGIMLFAQRQNGEHFPVSLKKPDEPKAEHGRMGSKMALYVAMPGTPIEVQKPAMEVYRVSLAHDLLTKKEA